MADTCACSLWIYKSTKCNDMRQTGYCPRGPFCAFAHIEKSLGMVNDWGCRDLHLTSPASTGSGQPGNPSCGWAPTPGPSSVAFVPWGTRIDLDVDDFQVIIWAEVTVCTSPRPAPGQAQVALSFAGREGVTAVPEANGVDCVSFFHGLRESGLRAREGKWIMDEGAGPILHLHRELWRLSPEFAAGGDCFQSQSQGLCAPPVPWAEEQIRYPEGSQCRQQDPKATEAWSQNHLAVFAAVHPPAPSVSSSVASSLASSAGSGSSSPTALPAPPARALPLSPAGSTVEAVLGSALDPHLSNVNSASLEKDLEQQDGQDLGPADSSASLLLRALPLLQLTFVPAKWSCRDRRGFS
ncbi:hypothetical protein H8959_010908 [Pygathrix nigripes]